MNIGERIKETRQIKGISQLELAEAIGIKQPAISQIERGGTKNTSYLQDIAAILHVNPYWLQTGLGPREPEDGTTFSSRKMPLLALADVPNDGIIDKDEVDSWVFCPFEHYGRKTFAVLVKDESMLAGFGEHSLHPDDYAFIDPDRAPKHGDFVLVRGRGTQKAKLRKYVEEEGQTLLYTSNPSRGNQYAPLQDTKILGTVIAVTQQF